MNISDLKSKYSRRARDPEGLFLLCAEDAISYIKECQAEGFTLEGVEGFRITEQGAYQPVQEQSNDRADTSEDQASFVESTITLIRSSFTEEYFYEVVVTSNSG